jgi:biopolymer transport protein ExbB
VDRNFMNQIQDMVQNGNIAGARSLCKNTDTPPARMLDKGLKKIGKPIEDIERALESAGKIEVYKLEKNLSILGTIAGIAPMFGFLGTIAGVIKIFYEINQANEISIGIVSGGLYEKMITSAAGLTVGIIAHAAYHFLLLKIDKEIFRMEATAIDFVDLLQEPTA